MDLLLVLFLLVYFNSLEEVFFVSINILRTGKCKFSAYEKLFFYVLKTTQNGDSYNYEYFTKVFDYFYTMGLCFYFSGIITILILDYLGKNY